MATSAETDKKPKSPKDPKPAAADSSHKSPKSGKAESKAGSSSGKQKPNSSGSKSKAVPSSSKPETEGKSKKETRTDKSDSQRPSRTNTTSTELPPTRDVAWQEGFTLGRGINAVTGAICASALDNFELKKETAKDSFYSIFVISNESELRDSLRTLCDATAPIPHVGGIGAGVDSLSRVEFSRTSFSIVVRYWSRFTSFDEPKDRSVLRPAPGVKALAEDVDAFRATYGDYFIVGGQRGSSYTAVIIYKTKTFSDKRTLVAKAHGSFGPGNVKATSKLSVSDFSRGVSCTTMSYFDMQGFGGHSAISNPKSVEDVLKALRKLEDGEVGKNMVARLDHYSTVHGLRTVPRTVPIDPESFQKLHELYRLVTEVYAFSGVVSRMVARMCPDFHGMQDLLGKVERLHTDTQTRKKDLLENRETRDTFRRRAKRYTDDLRKLHRRYRLYSEITASLQRSAPDGLHEAKADRETWTYGLKKFAEDPSLKITRKGLDPCKMSRSLLAQSTHVECTVPKDRLIIGLEVMNLRTDELEHNGSWRMLEDFVCKHEGKLQLTSKSLHRSEWKINLYHVAADDLPFVNS